MAVQLPSSTLQSVRHRQNVVTRVAAGIEWWLGDVITGTYDNQGRFQAPFPYPSLDLNSVQVKARPGQRVPATPSDSNALRRSSFGTAKQFWLVGRVRYLREEGLRHTTRATFGKNSHG